MDKQTIDTYNNLAKEYDSETEEFWSQFPRTIIDAFVTSVGMGGRILNIGSGPGRDGLILKNAGLDVVCLDASEEMVKMSRVLNLESVVGDFNNLPFEDGSFDGVWAYTSLLHVPKSEIEKSILEIKRVLKADGIFDLGLIEGDGELYRKSSGVEQLRWFSFFKKDEIEDLLQKYGFKIEYFEEFKPKTKKYLNFISKKIV